MKKINYLILLVVVFVGMSCEPTYEKEYSWSYPLSGDWKLNTYERSVINGEDSLTSSEYFEIKIYNSSFGKDSIWIDDYGTGVASASQYGHYWTMKFKVKADMTSKTFHNSKEVWNAIPGYKIGIKAQNGVVIGNDSIRFELQFEDDTTPYAKTYILAGRRIISYDDYMH